MRIKGATGRGMDGSRVSQSSGCRWSRDPVKLPSLTGALDKMSKFDLEHLVSELCQRDFSSGLFLGKIMSRPPWWPSHVEFSATWSPLGKGPLQEVIRCCYEFYNQEQLLCGPAVRDGPRSLRRTASQKQTSKPPKQSSLTRDKGLGKTNQENKENPQYVGQRMAMPYAASLPDRGYSGPSLPHPTKTSGSSPPTGQTPGMLPETALAEIFICFFCEKEFSGHSELASHQVVCAERPLELQVLANGSTKTKARRQLYPSPNPVKARSSPVDKSDFISSLGLLTKQEAVTLKTKDKCEEEIDCEIVEVEEPVQPTTPRTPKSLISQLSRDASPPPHFASGWKEKPFSIKMESDSDSDESVDERKPVSRSQKLFNIDLTSVLGQRLKKQFSALTSAQSGNNVEVGGQSWWEKHLNYETFCHTPTKSEPLEKLRNRNTYGYNVSFRTKKKMPKYIHKYHFNQRQRRARHLVLVTGLSQRSRCLKKQMPKVTVSLTRLKPEEVDKLTARRQSALIRLPAHVFPPSSPVVVNSQELQKLLSMRVPGCQMQSYHVSMLPNTSNLSQTKYFSLSPNSQSAMVETSPTLVGPSQDSQDRRLSSLLQSMLTGSKADPKPVNKHNVTPPIHPDPISISSDSEDEEKTPVRPASRKRPAESKEPEAKRARTDNMSSLALLFRCHFCKEELTCKHNMRQVIQQHYGREHNIHNIDLIEHTDNHGNQVISIVEMQMVKKSSEFHSQPKDSPTSASQSPVVDLTDDDDVVITGETPGKNNHSINANKLSRNIQAHLTAARKLINTTKTPPQCQPSKSGTLVPNGKKSSIESAGGGGRKVLAPVVSGSKKSTPTQGVWSQSMGGQLGKGTDDKARRSSRLPKSHAV